MDQTKCGGACTHAVAAREREKERKAEKGGADRAKRYPEARLDRQLGNKTVDI
jgi:NADPH:quinone reductase-like Zn-dependent oxidoreductase